MSEKLVGSCIFGQSGGPTSVINASAYGVIKTALEAEEITKVYGASHGWMKKIRKSCVTCCILPLPSSVPADIR